ncbi:MAG TPA: type IV toxin-antitoxin system AbiEi family antitoxin domain-containing protein, partial [Solirubrobacteraceae bacterium]|nr:type IV toxin-antitoxin system AbiEi family antitoxin domain-containing protein [Solirubrobacteraceae bacterium]
MRPETAQPAVDHTIAALAARQHGVMSRGQLRGLGLSDQAIGRRVRSGRLHRVHRGVYALLPRSLGDSGDAMAAVLACGDLAVISHRSAAALWALHRQSTGPTEVTVPTRAGRAQRAGIRIHRCALTTQEITSESGLPITTVARTLLDIAPALDANHLESAIDRAEHLRLFDLRAVQAILAAHPHRPGATRLTAAIGDHATGPVLRSELERAFLALCAEHH